MPLTIHLTEEQRQALAAEQSRPVEVVDPATNCVYVLLAAEAYERLRAQGAAAETPGAAFGIPPGVLRAQQAFWRDLPGLLRDQKNHGRWAAYHGDRRIGTAPTKTELIREVLRQGIPRDESYVGRVRPQTLAPWEAVEVEATHPHDREDPPPAP